MDTGPGIDELGDVTMATELHDATAVADDARDAGANRSRDMAGARTFISGSVAGPANEPPGEGVGLSIVKRLCELLEASLELATKPGHGSTFRVILPTRYGA
jgi:light-regulated signal transduction histidine kinase (bacteriophytochrome)